jgi:hypothetical protein
VFLLLCVAVIVVAGGAVVVGTIVVAGAADVIAIGVVVGCVVVNGVGVVCVNGVVEVDDAFAVVVVVGGVWC